MGQKLNPNEKELYKRVDEVLYYVWDPIGVSGAPAARDEYYTYVPKVFSLLLKDPVDRKAIADYLIHVSNDLMELSSCKDKAETAVDFLVQWKEKIFTQDTVLETTKLFSAAFGDEAYRMTLDELND